MLGKLRLYRPAGEIRKPEAKAVGLKGQSPAGYYQPRRGFALSARGFSAYAGQIATLSSGGRDRKPEAKAVGLKGQSPVGYC